VIAPLLRDNPPVALQVANRQVLNGIFWPMRSDVIATSASPGFNKIRYLPAVATRHLKRNDNFLASCS
jgi:hypothetical protein